MQRVYSLMDVWVGRTSRKWRANLAASRQSPVTVCSLAQVFVIVLALGSGGLPERRAKAAESFPVAREFSQFDIRRWRQEHPHDGGNGWFPGKLETTSDGTLVVTDATRHWGHWLGPLGIRVRSHLANWQRHPALAALTPDVLRSRDGSLALQAMEVVHVVPGSPAEGHLFPGDLLVQFMGQPIYDGAEYRPEDPFVHKDRREIQVQAGELIDQAEAEGVFHCMVLRNPNRDGVEVWKSGVLTSGESAPASVEVSSGDRVMLLFEDGGDGKDYDHGAWLDGVFSGPAGESGLTEETPVEMVSGWGTVAKNVDFRDKPLASKGWRCHARGHLTFEVPEGMDHLDVTAASLSTSKGNITAAIRLFEASPRLPVETSILWDGVVGNKDIGEQGFDVAVSEAGRLHLRVGDAGDNIHGDGAVWADVVLYGDYGQKRLSSLKPLSLHNGYGRVQVLSENPLEHNGKTYRDGWRCHAVSDFIWSLPAGTKRIKGRFAPLSYGKVAPQITVEPILETPPDTLQAWIQAVQFPVAKIGAFVDTFPYGCEKSELLLEQTCDWLAAQQREDGSWPCWAGYTTDSFHTAFCGLALMSAGDRKYDDHVWRAAKSVSWDMGPSGWTCPRSMVLIFLSELYLRDRDPRLLLPIQNAARQLVACVKTDLMAGHGVNGFGYGYAGQYIGTGFMELGLALASLCPIEMDREYVDDVLAHIGEISCNGAYPYGRGWRAIRDQDFHKTGGNAMHGPAALAARITGCRFSEQVVDDAIKRWNAVIGDGDNSHATSTLAYIWSSLAMHACDVETFQRHMQAFRYKMANDHSFDGGWLKSSFVLDFQGGEGVTGLWIRSAGMALILATPRKELAITGRPTLVAETLQPGTPCREYDLFVRDFYARNLSLAKAVLGEAAPASIMKLREDLLGLPQTSRLNAAQAKLLRARIPRLVQNIAKIDVVSDQQRGHAIELVSGIDFQVLVDEKQCSVTARLPFQQLAWADSDAEIQRLSARQMLPFQARLSFAEPGLNALVYEFDSAQNGWDWRLGSRTQKLPVPDGLQVKEAPMLIEFRAGDSTVRYVRPIRFRDPDAKGRVSDVTNFRRLTVRTTMAANPVYQTQPIMLDGKAFEAMLLNEAANFATFEGRRPDGDQPIAVHEGDEVEVEIVSAQPLCLEVVSMDIRSRPQRVVPESIAVVTEGFELRGDQKMLGDLSYAGDVHLEGPKDADHVVFELRFAEPVRLNGLDLHWNGGQRLVELWALVDGRGVPLAWDGYDSRSGFHPTFPEVTTERLRIKLSSRGQKVALKELTPYYNRAQRSLFRPLWSR